MSESNALRVHPLWRQQWEAGERSPYQRLSFPDIAWHFGRELYRKDPAAAVDDDMLDIGFGPGASRLPVVEKPDMQERVGELGRRLTEQDRALGPDVVGAPIAPPESAPGRTLPVTSLKPADYSIRERIGNAAADIGAALGASRYQQQDLRRGSSEATDFVPGLNITVGVNDAARNFQAGRYEEGAVDAALTVASVLPLVGGIAKSGTRVAKGEGAKVASSRGLSYDPPPQPPRPFTDDYPNGARTDAEGRITRDIDGRNIHRKARVAGRAVDGGADQPVDGTERPALAQRTTAQAPKRAPLDHSGGTRFSYDPATRRFKRIEGIVLADDLPDDEAVRVLAHEIAHSIDFRVAPARTVDSFHEGRWGIESSDPKVQDQLYRIYTDLNNPQANRWGPLNDGYTQSEEARELWAEAIRAYMTDPNYIKTVAPETAAVIRRFANGSPRVNKIIHFNSLAGGAGVAAAAGGASEEEGNDEGEARQSR